MNKFGNILKTIRTQQDIRQSDLAKAIGVSPSTIGMYEQGRRDPDSDTVIKLAEYFNVTTDYLLGNSNIKNMKSKPKGVKIPVLGRVQAGVPIEAVTDIIDYEEITEELNRTGDFFALQVNGNSMEPRMLEGDVVIVRKQPYIESGEVAIVLVNGCDATIKKVIKQDNGLLLVASNAEVYQPTFYSTEDIEELPVSIIGKVVELRGKF